VTRGPETTINTTTTVTETTTNLRPRIGAFFCLNEARYYFYDGTTWVPVPVWQDAPA
jgi:hypothetical protein